jgi:hypothetical protein
MGDQGEETAPGRVQGDAVKAAAVSAARNVPPRTKSRLRQKSSTTAPTLVRLESFDNIPDYLRDNE